MSKIIVDEIQKTSGTALTWPSADGSADQFIQTDGSGTLSFAASFAAKNFLINSGFRVAQRGTSFTAATTHANTDDNYLLDRWILLSDTNDVVDISQETTTIPDGAYASMKALVATINKKFGFLQILEARDSALMNGKTVSLRFEARTNSGAAISNLRAAILSWDGTADSPTSDVVSAWEASGTNPTLVSNWTYENTAANLSLTVGSFGTHKIEGVSVDTSGMKNVAVFIWVDDTDPALNDVVFIGNVQLELASTSGNYAPVNYLTELLNCQRYFFNDTNGVAGEWRSDTTVDLLITFPVPMRIPATGTLLDSSPTVRDVGNTNITGSSSSLSNLDTANSRYGAVIDGFSSATDQNYASLMSDDLEFDAEL